jgi:hypothetical protein
MVRVQAVSLPGVMAEHDLRSDLSDDASDLCAYREGAVQFAIDVTEETDLARAAR